MARPRYKYQVFVSSTFADLRKEREAVTWGVLKARHIPLGMEIFPATNDRGWKVIERTINDSDYYVLLLAGRYGSVDPSTEISWTEREYDYAWSKNIPILAFVREKSSIRGDNMETGEGATKLAAFIEKVHSRHLCLPWTSEEDLAGKVVQSLHDKIQEDEDDGNQRPGWIRGDTISGNAVDELARLSKENAELRAQVDALGGTKKAVLELRFDGQGPELSIEVPSYELAPQGPAKGARFVRIEDLVERMSRTVWLRATITNKGDAVARNIRTRFKVTTEVEEIDLNRSEIKYLMPIESHQTPWYLNPSEDVYVSSHYTADDYARVEQRAKTLGVGQDERLVGVGLVLPELPLSSSEEIRFSVEYSATSEQGEQTAGTLAVSVRRGPAVVVSAEELIDLA